MDRETSRRAVIAAALGAGVAGGYLSPAKSFLERFAPLSGTTWTAARARRQSTVTSPHGDAEVRYDDEGVPHISADDEAALYFAVGYVQGTDRLFQMELQRRLFSGRLSEIVGDVTVDSDTFHRQMMFRDAAEATAEHLREEGPEAVVTTGEAYAEGVNAAMEEETLPVEFQLLEHEPEPWTLTDSMLVEKLMGWNLTGKFKTLRKAHVREEFSDGMAEDLYPYRLEYPYQVVRDHHDFDDFGKDTFTEAPQNESVGTPSDGNDAIGKPLLDKLTRFEPDPHLGSNSWVVGTDLAAGDAPIVCNDPHLALQAPPVWYEMHIDGPEHRVRGVTFPGVPFVIVGENDHGAWGFTNANDDVIDFYSYEAPDAGSGYQYGDEVREFEVETQEIEVSGGENEDIEVTRSVHGPVIEEADREVGIAWTGHAATETVIAAYEMTHSEGVDEVREAMSRFDSPTQNYVYADQDDNTMYHMVGTTPIRRTDGDPVRGDRIFSAAEREGEWHGFEPFTRPEAWESVPETNPDIVPFEDKPNAYGYDYLCAANQQAAKDEDLGYYLSDGYAPRYRSERIYNLLDDLVESGDPIDLDDMADIGRDTRDGRAAALVPDLVDAARAGNDAELLDAADTLADWDYQMDVDSEAALLFAVWLETYRDELFEDPFEEADLDDDYYPSHGAVEEFPDDSEWFEPDGKRAIMREALRKALDEIENSDVETFGDRSHTGVIEHPLGGQLDFLNFPEYPRGGTESTVMNFGIGGPWGGAWEMQVDLDGEYHGILAGGNSGRYFSDHYDDQLERWANGTYRTISRDIEGDLVTTFEEGER